MREVVDVDAAGRHVGGHEDVGGFLLEAAQDFLPLSLRHVAVQPLGRIAAFGQPAHQFVHAHLGPAEDDAVEFGFHVHDARQRVELVAVAHLEVDLVRQLGGDFLCGNFQQLGVPHVFFREVYDAFGHRGREQQDAAVLVRVGEDFLHVLDEAHVEHFVGFVENQVFEFLDVERTAPQMVEDAAGRAHHDVDAFAQTAQLFAHRSPAVDGRHGEFPLRVERKDFFGYLQRQFARGNQNQRLRRPFERTEPFEDGQSESCGLSRSGLGLGDDVVRFFRVQQNGDRELLDRRRSLETFGPNGFEGPFRQTQSAEFFQLNHVCALKRLLPMTDK